MFKFIDENKQSIVILIGFALVISWYTFAVPTFAIEPPLALESEYVTALVAEDEEVYIRIHETFGVYYLTMPSGITVDMATAIRHIEQGYERESTPPAQSPTELAILSFQPDMPTEQLNTLVSLIIEHAELNNLDPLFVVALIKQESNFNPTARGIDLFETQEDGTKKFVGYCCGLMQLHTMHGIKNVYDPEVNIRAGCAKLKSYIDQRDGNLRKGLWRWGLKDSQAGEVLKRYVKLLKQFGGEYELIEEMESLIEEMK